MMFEQMKYNVVGILGGISNTAAAIGNLLHAVGCQVHLTKKSKTGTPDGERATWFAVDNNGESVVPFI